MNIPYYFAYGSNMNPARMQARGLTFNWAQAARLPGYRLRFNKQSHANPGVSYANIEPATGARVEGVLYQLCDAASMAVMDGFEGTPVRYSRESLAVQLAGEGEPVWQQTWVYLANPAFINNSLLPESRYLEHLLAGRDFLSGDYLAALRDHPSHQSEALAGDAGLKFNV